MAKAALGALVGSAAMAALFLAAAPPTSAQTSAEKCLDAKIARFHRIEGADREITAAMLKEWQRECEPPAKLLPAAASARIDTTFLANAAREGVSLFSLPDVQRAYHAYLRPPGSSGLPEALPEGLTITDLGPRHALTLVCMDLQCHAQEAVIVDLVSGEAALCSADLDSAAGAVTPTIWKFNGRPPQIVAAQPCPAKVSELSAAFLRGWGAAPTKPAGQVVARPQAPAAAVITPAQGSPQRKAMLDALRPHVERDLGAPVEFVVRTLRTSGKHGFAAVDAQRPGGGRIDPARTPKGRHMATQHALDLFNCCHAEAVLERGPNGWRVAEFVTGATDVWYEPWYDKLPRGLFAP